MASDRPGTTAAGDGGHFKDAILDDLAREHNVAQFVSFAPGASLDLRYCRIQGDPRPSGAAEAVKLLLERSAEASVNIRSFDPHEPKSRDFFYGLKAPGEVLDRLAHLAATGLHTIVNETVDVHDGGVSGVVLGGTCELSPDDTPRAVEKDGTLSLPVADTDRLVEIVYGFDPGLARFAGDTRIEFSVHPLRRGLRNEHVIVWEAEALDGADLVPQTEWPNNFSRLVGDKAFGLLVAHLLGLPVPFTTVVTRRLAPFSFGARTGTGEIWIRTAPREPVPGLFTTKKGWLDPVALWQAEDPDGDTIASVLAQQGVDSVFSGALLADEEGTLTVEGVRGEGADFMQGLDTPVDLPEAVVAGVTQMFDVASSALGPVRMEWAYDGKTFWVLQMHRGFTRSRGRVVFPGDAPRFHELDVDAGIAALRRLVDEVAGTGEGVVLVGNVGVTSHFGDILRRARIPSRIEPRRSV
ncbi:MAG: hypothetical protein M3323_12955 [Actinomycetota bacterium]|nr:hypothetical protein [Actinomycetota bacterium]